MALEDQFLTHSKPWELLEDQQTNVNSFVKKNSDRQRVRSILFDCVFELSTTNPHLAQHIIQSVEHENVFVWDMCQHVIDKHIDTFSHQAKKIDAFSKIIAGKRDMLERYMEIPKARHVFFKIMTSEKPEAISLLHAMPFSDIHYQNHYYNESIYHQKSQQLDFLISVLPENISIGHSIGQLMDRDFHQFYYALKHIRTIDIDLFLGGLFGRTGGAMRRASETMVDLINHINHFDFTRVDKKTLLDKMYIYEDLFLDQKKNSFLFLIFNDKLSNEKIFEARATMKALRENLHIHGTLGDIAPNKKTNRKI